MNFKNKALRRRSATAVVTILYCWITCSALFASQQQISLQSVSEEATGFSSNSNADASTTNHNEDDLSKIKLKFIPVHTSTNSFSVVGGSVEDDFRIGTSMVTVRQYCTFLNAVAVADTYNLYHETINPDSSMSAIVRSGLSGSYHYSIVADGSLQADSPVTSITWLDAARFCNWLQNNQPVGSQDSSTTEDGAYTLSGDLQSPVAVNAEAKYFLPTATQLSKISLEASSDAMIQSGSLSGLGEISLASLDPNLADNNVGFYIAAPWKPLNIIVSPFVSPNPTATDYPSVFHFKKDLAITSTADLIRVTLIEILIAAVGVGLGVLLGALLAPYLGIAVEQAAIVSGGTASSGVLLRAIGKINQLSTMELVGLFFAVVALVATLSIATVIALGLFGELTAELVLAKTLLFSFVALGELTIAAAEGFFFGIL